MSTTAYLWWMGIPVRKRYVQGPGVPREADPPPATLACGSAQDVDPRDSRASCGRPQAGDDSQATIDRINGALERAWEALRPHLQQAEDGFLLQLDEIAVLSELSSGEICPNTSRVLDTTLRGISPYLPERGEPKPCVKFSPPRVPKAYWRDESGGIADRDEITTWFGDGQGSSEGARARGLVEP